MVQVTNPGDVLCNYCIAIMENMSDLTGLSYGLINVLLFIVLGPLSTLCFMGSTATAYFGKTRFVRTILTCILSVIGFLAILTILIPVIWATLTLKV